METLLQAIDVLSAAGVGVVAWRVWTVGVQIGRLLERLDRLERDVSGLLAREHQRAGG